MAETGRKKRLPELGRRGFLSKSRDAKEGSPLKQSPGGSPKRPNSPEPNCSICLGGIEDQSFANKCFHSFCKTCLFEWSKVKPECPVCRQGFDSIIFNVKAMDDYEEYNIPRPLSPRSLWSVGAYITESGRWETREISSFNILRHRVIHLQDMFERSRANREPLTRAPRRLSFFYAIDPTTGTRDNNSGANLASATNSNNNNNTERTPPRAHESSRTSGFHFDLAAYIRNLDTVPRPPTAGTFDHRRYIYEHDLWVQPINGRLARECSATFYRTNPAVTHRLLPFLNRELVAILRDNSEPNHSAEALLSRIKAAIFEYDIPSIRFRQVIEPYTRDKTHHFLHELYYFAKSPYTIEDYNVHAIYVPKSHVKQLKLEQPVNRPFAVFTNDQEPEADSSTDDSVIELVDFEQEHNSRRDNTLHGPRMTYIALSSSSSSSSVSATRTNTTAAATPTSVIEATSEKAKPGYDEKETRKAIKHVQKLTKEMSSHANQEKPLTLTLSTLSQNINVIEDFDNPRPGPSGLCRKNDFKTSNPKLKVDDDGSDTEIDIGTNEKPMVKQNYDSDSEDSDASIKVVGFKKPIRERTPEIINISSCGESAGDGLKKSDDEEDDSDDYDEGPEKKRLKIVKELPLKLTKGSSGLRYKIERVKGRNNNENNIEDDKITDSEGSENEKEKSSKKKQKKRRRTKSSHSKRRKDSSSTRQIDIDGNTTVTDSTSSDDESSVKRSDLDSYKFLRRIPSVIVRPHTLKTSSTSNLLRSFTQANNPVIHNHSSSSTTATATTIPTTVATTNSNNINSNDAGATTSNSDISNTTKTNTNSNNVIATLCSSLKRKFDVSTDTESTDNDTCERFNDILRAFI